MEHKHAEILRAIADGKEVEWFGGGNHWIKAESIINPLSYPHYQWRIKPEKQVLRYRVARLQENTVKNWLYFAVSDNAVNRIEKSDCFVEWIHDWQEVEVE